MFLTSCYGACSLRTRSTYPFACCDTEAANPAVRVNLVQAIAAANPAFVCFTGDIVYNGNDTSDWKTWDSETSIWRDKKIPIYPALGNHDLHGDEKIARWVIIFSVFPHSRTAATTR